MSAVPKRKGDDMLTTPTVNFDLVRRIHGIANSEGEPETLNYDEVTDWLDAVIQCDLLDDLLYDLEHGMYLPNELYWDIMQFVKEDD